MSEESARKARIRRQIRSKQDIVNRCQKELTILERERGKQQTSLDEWIFQEQLRQDTQIMNEVVVPGVFEGVSAEQIRELFLDSFQQMIVTKQELADEMIDLGQQISDVRDYISQLESEIQSLRNRL